MELTKAKSALDAQMPAQQQQESSGLAIAEQRVTQAEEELAQARLAVTDSNQRIQELTTAQATAESKVERMRGLYQKLRAEYEELTAQNGQIKAELLAVEQRSEQRTEQPTDEIARTKAISETLHSEFAKRRTYVEQLRKDLERTQTSLVASQRQAEQIDTERKEVNLLNESLRQSLSKQQHQNR